MEFVILFIALHKGDSTMGFKPRKKQNLTQSVSNTPEKIFEAFKSRRDERGWNISDKVMDNLLGLIPLLKARMEYQKVSEVVIAALIPPPEGSSMGALQYSFEEFWSWIESTQNGNVFRHPGIKTDSDHLSFLNGYSRVGLGQAGWLTVNLNGAEHRYLRKRPGFSVGLEFLALAAQCPQKVLAMDGGKDNPYWNLAGLNLFMPDTFSSGSECSPSLSVLNGKVSLLYNHHSAPYHSPGGWVSPEFNIKR